MNETDPSHTAGPQGRTSSRPRRMTPTLCALAAGTLASLGLAGCSLPQAQADPTRFFVLSALAAPVAPTPAGAPAVHVRAVELASYLQSRAIVLRRGANELEFREFARWSEPLEQGIARVLREELLTRGSAASVSLPGVRAASRAADREVTLRVLACEGAADGAVIFRAGWEVWGTDERPAVLARGTFSAQDLRWDATSESSLAAQLSQAVAGLAGEIADALKR